MSERDATSMDPEQNEPTARKTQRGFAAMQPEQARELSRRGGRAAHRAGTAHEFTSQEAQEVGRKGGLARQAKLRQASRGSGA
jgi:general stress protein YciG